MRASSEDMNKFLKYLNKFGSDLEKINSSKRFTKYELKELQMLYVNSVFSGLDNTSDIEDEDPTYPGYQIRNISKVDLRSQAVSCTIRTCFNEQFKDVEKRLTLNGSVRKLYSLLDDYKLHLIEQLNKTKKAINFICPIEEHSDMSTTSEDGIYEENESEEVEITGEEGESTGNTDKETSDSISEKDDKSELEKDVNEKEEVQQSEQAERVETKEQKKEERSPSAQIPESSRKREREKRRRAEEMDPDEIKDLLTASRRPRGKRATD